MEPNSPKKIQFAMPLFHSHLDPQAAEHIRRRRPTPATLVIYNEPPAAEADDKRTSEGQGEVPSMELSPAQRKQSVYTPPTMKGRECADAHRAQEERGDGRHSQHSQPHSDTRSKAQSGTMPRRKDTPYQHSHPFPPGGNLLRAQRESPFPEEEEGLEEQEEDRNP
ncbi:hypothetical protein AAFF_G00328020 [Aldrovandia affinis]|uniref:Protein phosphatase 1 regulatory subunit 1C n=1 Tax=Aldrovandia affinis TaxID=143900 RepID=A0AAD7X2F0_9TELE|nr:hypothetical protein AAFF_G00328020 [Aldrovandia affinis]